MLYTKNGSIPKPQTDGTEGWIEVADKPECPEGKEVVWLNWEWVVRDPKPDDRDGYQWNWNHGEMAWIESSFGVVDNPETPLEFITTEQLLILSTEQLSQME
jgi:hypothetical protein